jgi:L-alanine-DL-glutamate epimerase-like enolase superfamily enzyme
MKQTDIRPIAAKTYHIPAPLRVELKFGAGDPIKNLFCNRVFLTVKSQEGNEADGVGETPINMPWAWPSQELSYQEREAAMLKFCKALTKAWAEFGVFGHPIMVGHRFQEDVLKGLWEAFNDSELSGKEKMPWLAALVCCSAFDIAMHDAYGNLLDKPIYSLYGRDYMEYDLSNIFTDELDSVLFRGTYPETFLAKKPLHQLPAWHLVGGKDLINVHQIRGDEPDDGYPILLRDWIRRDGLTCLKIKLRGNDEDWDMQRLIDVGEMAIANGVVWLTVDFNCTVTESSYVNDILDWLMKDHPRIHQMILYVEQPFPYDLEKHQIKVHTVAMRKPLFMDESAHNWKLIGMGLKLGWTGVALKTCKTQTEALLSMCWAKAHGMMIMVQDLTNPMLAQIPHVLLAAHAETICGVETNAMQFYPAVSADYEAIVHPGIYRRRNGKIDLETLFSEKPGFGYMIKDMPMRVYPDVAAEAHA